MWLKEYFTIEIDLLILAIGVYMAFVQSHNLMRRELLREGRFSQIVGYMYLIIGGFGVLIYMSYQ